jgi:ubiquinone/menaquinone biosynthesis C-methylase UbiE
MSVTGADVASVQLEFARETIREKNWENRVQFVNLPTSGVLPFPDASYDAVTVVEVIEHLHPLIVHTLLSEAKRVLKPGGKIIITTPNYRSFWPLIEFAMERLSQVKYHDQHINKLTPNSLVKTIESAGFEIVKLGTLFSIAPFLAPISARLANAVLRWESRRKVKTGALLIAECQPMDLEAFGIIPAQKKAEPKAKEAYYQAH